VYFMTNFTPRAANVVNQTNRPPILNTINNVPGNELALITFTASATDPDTGQTLTFTLDPGSPAGASINPGTGVFSWTPTEAQGPSSYATTVRVTDNGSPPMSDPETITVTVNEVNTAPTLNPINNLTNFELLPITFTATASDSDLPPNTLSFSLLGAP